jgi:hypothetical protein
MSTASAPKPERACQYATNVCEHCPGFRSDASHLAVLSARHIDD